MSDANPRTQCARLFDGSGLGWRCTRPIGHQGQHCSSSFMPGFAVDGSARYILTRYQGSTEKTPLTALSSPNVPSSSSRGMGGDLR